MPLQVFKLLPEVPVVLINSFICRIHSFAPPLQPDPVLSRKLSLRAGIVLVDVGSEPRSAKAPVDPVPYPIFPTGWVHLNGLAGMPPHRSVMALRDKAYGNPGLECRWCFHHGCMSFSLLLAL